MKTIEKRHYVCDVCGGKYDSVIETYYCEERPVTQDKGVKVGDIVRIINGDGTGELAMVERIFIYNKEWGHYAWERYWHTVGLVAKLIDSYGYRQLTFDDYEVVK